VRINKLIDVACLTLLALALCQCSDGAGTSVPAPDRLAATCRVNPIDPAPARRVVQGCSNPLRELPRTLGPIDLGGLYDGIESWLGISCARKIVLLDDGPAGTLKTDEQMAVDAYDFAGEVDRYYRDLADAGIGAWDGCYGHDTTAPILTSTLHATFTGFQDFSSNAETLFQDGYVTRIAVAHEWTHAVFFRQTPGLDLEKGEMAVISESLSDTMAFAITGERAYQIGTEGHVRNFAHPDETDDPTRYDEYTPALSKYENAGILNRAAYLLMRDVSELLGADAGSQVIPIGRQKVGMIYFHAMQPPYLTKDRTTLQDFAQGIEQACRNLADRPAPQAVATIDEKKDCDQVLLAFAAVGLPPELSGAWRGSVQQSGVDSYTVTIALTNCTPGKTCGVVEYPSLGCGGSWTMTSAVSGRNQFTEKLATGLDRCADAGDVSLERMPDGKWKYVWSNPKYGMATARLTRSR
jgi:hypothetical protein